MRFALRVLGALIVVVTLLLSSPPNVPPGSSVATVRGSVSSASPRPFSSNRPPAVGTPDSTIGTAAGSWPTLGFNSQRTGANPLESVVNLSNVSQLAPLWTFHTSGGVTDSLAVVNGTAYFGSWNGTLFAVNTSTGAQEWETDLGGAYDYTGCDSPGITSTPTVWNNTVYVGGSNPWEYALNASTGTILWHVDLANLTGSSSPWTAYKTWSSALVVNGSLYVGTASGCDDPLVRAALLQIGLSNHSIEHISYVVPAGDIGDSIWSSPSFDAASNTVWATTGNGETDLETYARAIVAFNASNASDVVGYAQEAEPGHDYDFGDGVTIFHNSQGVPMVVALNKNGFAYAFNLSTFQGNVSADPAWTLQVTTDPGSSYSPPAFDGHLLYFGSAETTLPNSTAANGSVRAVYPGNGTTKWLVEVPYSVFGGLTYANGLIFASLTGGFADQSQGGLIVLDASNGRSLYYRPGNASWGEPVVLNGEVLYTSGVLSPVDGGSVTALALPLSGVYSSHLIAGELETTYRLQAAPSGGVPPYNVSWTLGDNSSAFGNSVVHSFATGGAFHATLSIRDSIGEVVGWNLTLTAGDPLFGATSITPDPVSLGEAVWLNLTLAGGGSAPYVYDWSGLPAGTEITGNTSADMFLRPAAEGEFNVTSVVTSGTGQSITVNFPTLWVDGPQKISIAEVPGSGEAPLNVSFSVRFGYSDITAAYAWEFGDANTSNQESPYHLYQRPGSYTVSVTVTYPGGSNATDSATVVVSSSGTLSVGELVILAGFGVGASIAGIHYGTRRRRRPT